MQRKQHQPDPDRYAAKILKASPLAAPEREDADGDQHRKDNGHVERQDLDDQRRADIGAEHDGERGNELQRTGAGEGHRHQRRRRRGLQGRGHAEAGEKRVEARLQAACQPAAEVGAEDTNDAALHHVDAPQQERDLADQVDEEMCGGHATGDKFCEKRGRAAESASRQMSQICRKSANSLEFLVLSGSAFQWDTVPPRARRRESARKGTARQRRAAFRRAIGAVGCPPEA